MQDASISRHRLSEPPGEVYTRTVLEPSYHFMLDHYFEGLLSAHEAWIVMLAEEGVVPADSAVAVVDGVATLRRGGKEEFAEFDPRYEYFYSHIEQRLTELVGARIAGDINVARTRPEPLTRMAVRENTQRAMGRLISLSETLLTLAMDELETVMPQWTHLQPAQPSTLAHYLTGMADAILRDATRLVAAHNTTNQSTLGCGALAGTSYSIDRGRVAELLGFDGVRENAIDCVGSGDYATETAAAVSGLNINLSRLSQDMYLWCTVEFGYAEVGDSYAGSSSMMPQKKNAYPFEYVRAQAARSIGDLGSVLGALHNTTFGDVKDVEEGMVPPLLRLLEETVNSLELLTGTISTMKFNRNRMQDEAARGFATATELAAVLHRTTDLDFRSAHRIVGSLVRVATDRGIEPEEVGAGLVVEVAEDTLGEKLDISEQQVRDALDPRLFVRAHDSKGGAAPSAVRANASRARERTHELETWLSAQKNQLQQAESMRREAVGELRGA